MLSFTDLIDSPDPELTRVKFNIKNGPFGPPAWDELLDDGDKWISMNAWGKNSSDRINGIYLLTFAQYYPYGKEYYVFGGMYTVTQNENAGSDSPDYQLGLMDDSKEYRHRLIVKLSRPVGERRVRKYAGFLENLKPEVHELAPRAKLGPFPGYQNVRLKHKDLQEILYRDEPSWRQALQSVKAVYVITDLTDGKQYVGSASGNTDGLWQRWSQYADLRNLSGANKELDELRASFGDEHIKQNFQYSILEIFDTRTKQEQVLLRESHWKRVLDTRKHGLNGN